jgi:predicted DCC family thiol-disulfide oxidoreductase YuxK
MAFPVLLYDGACGFCGSTVQLILRWDRRKVLRFAPLQGRFAASIRASHPEIARHDSIVWVEPDAPEGLRVFVRSDAALRAAAYLGGFWRAALVARLLPQALRDRAYDFVARNRHRVPLSAGSCLVPTAETKERFLP